MLSTRHIKRATALALALGASVPAAASAKPIGPDPTPFTARATPLTAPAIPIVRVTVPASGFDWTDAGIGAAGGLALTMLGVGGALVVSQRRAHHPRRPIGPTG